MAFITIFSAPKPFNNPHIATIQRNAISSWTELADLDVILLGQEAGLAEAARELGVKHIPDVRCNAGGTPLISSMFELARKSSDSPLLCIINADILLLPDFVEAARRLSAQPKQSVLLGQRWDLEIDQRLDFSGDWVARLRASVRAGGKLHRPAGSDYFLFPRDCYIDIPDFAIGRAGWDNWMIYKARREGWPVIDATPSVMIVHQNHDYSHLPGGKPHYNHPETEENIRLAGGRAMTRFTLLDANYCLENGEILPQKMDAARLWRRLEAWPLLAFSSTKLSNALWRLGKIFRRKKSKKS
jgi:hypothetical protein